MDRKSIFFSRMTIELSKSRSEEMVPANPKTFVKGCIDFRIWEDILKCLEKNHGLKIGDFFLEARAGSSINSSELSRDFGKFVGFDHETCGRYAAEGDDSTSAHNKNMKDQGEKLKQTNPHLNYQSHLLPVQDTRHECEAVAIILGKPAIVKQVFEEITKERLSGNCDIIARPDNLSVDDNTIWRKSHDIKEKGDLPISLELHHPKRILIFDESEENARMLVEKVREIAEGIEVEPRVISQAA